MDDDQMRLQGLAAIRGLLYDLSPEDWNQPSLCQGWRVRDVIGHVCTDSACPAAGVLARRGGTPAATSFFGSS